MSIRRRQPYAGPGAFNDYDSIEVGNGSNDGLTPVECTRDQPVGSWGGALHPRRRSYSPGDPTDLQKYLENSAVLAVDQDSIAAKRVLNTGNQQVFAKREPNGDTIIGSFNTGRTPEEVSVRAPTAGVPENESGYSLHDLWTGETRNTTSTISAVVPSWSSCTASRDFKLLDC